MWILRFFNELWTKFRHSSQDDDLKRKSIQYIPQDIYDLNVYFQYGSTSEIF